MSSGYSFLAGGHWYGAHENVHSLRVASSLYAAIPAIKAAQPDRIFALGDVVRDAGDVRQIHGFVDLQTEIGVGIRVAPGNHDLNRNGYFRFPHRFGTGNTFTYFNGDRFLVLNTEMLVNKQSHDLIEFVQKSFVDVPEGRNLFVFTHRLVWALAEPGFSEMDDFANEPIGDKAPLDSIKMLYDAVCRHAPSGRMWWFSGDVGASWSLTLFEGRSRDGLRHFYAAGLGDRPEDAFWRVDVDSLGEVNVSPFPLVDAKALEPHQDLQYWRGKMKEVMAENQAPGGLGFGRLLQTLSLWIGLVLGALIGVLGMYVIRRRKR
ncbi:MAG: metallophosphoesterase [Bacteroidia bacterium]